MGIAHLDLEASRVVGRIGVDTAICGWLIT